MKNTPDKRVLGIETSTLACSIALDMNDGVDQIHQELPRRHNQAILGMVQDLLVRNNTRVYELTAICFGRGPGSFTGTRIAAAVAQGLALPFNIPLYAVSSLYALAAGFVLENSTYKGVVSLIKCRRGEFYRGVFEVQHQRVQQCGSEVICNSDLVLADVETTDHWVVVYDEEAPQINADTVKLACKRPNAVGLLTAPLQELEALDVDKAVPVYLQGTRPWRKL